MFSLKATESEVKRLKDGSLQSRVQHDKKEQIAFAVDHAELGQKMRRCEPSGYQQKPTM